MPAETRTGGRTYRKTGYTDASEVVGQRPLRNPGGSCVQDAGT